MMELLVVVVYISQTSLLAYSLTYLIKHGGQYRRRDGDSKAQSVNSDANFTRGCLDGWPRGLDNGSLRPI